MIILTEHNIEMINYLLNMNLINDQYLFDIE